MALESEYKTLMETLGRGGEVTKMPEGLARKVREGVARDLAEYSAESKIRQFRSEQEIMITVLNA